MELTIDQALQKAIEVHKSGELQGAERLYRGILQVQPQHPDANHNLGVLAVAVGKPEAALPLFKTALEANPKQGQFWLSYIDALFKTKQLDLARAVLNQGKDSFGLQGSAVDALEKQLSTSHPTPTVKTTPEPQLLTSEQRLSQAKQALKKGNVSVAEQQLYKAILQDHPHHSVANKGLRKLQEGLPRDQPMPHDTANPAKDQIQALIDLYYTGQMIKVEQACQTLLQTYPQALPAINLLGAALQAQGKSQEALASYDQAIKLKPNYAEAYSNRGVVLKELGQLAEAIASYDQAIKLKPDDVGAYYNRGNALKGLGQLAEAIASYDQALKLKPDYAEAYSNRGNALKELGQLAEAMGSYDQALKLKPDLAEAYSSRGDALQELGLLAEAMASYDQALKLKPDVAEAYSNRGTVLQELGQLAEAMASYDQAIKLKPDFGGAYSNRLFSLNYSPDLSAEEIFLAYREYDERFGLPFRTEDQTYNCTVNPKRRLKIGYVSPDFRNHAVTRFLEPLLASHNHDHFDVFAFAELKIEDAATLRYKTYVDHWVNTAGMRDDVLATHIKALGIDILVDLAGHTKGHRLPVFARKPTPISISWLGYGYTTGLSAIDYYLTDSVMVPAGSEHLFSEAPWRLKGASATYRPAEGMGHVGMLPASERGFITFGSLTRAVRINHRVIRVWSEILKRTVNSRLLINSASFKEPQWLIECFAAEGITSDRLDIGFSSPPWDLMRAIDIGLDCFPHNSGTTLFEHLYMGNPYITLAGRPSVGRIGASILEGVGHPEWIADSEEAYIEKAVALAADQKALAGIRSRLRSEIEHSEFMDEQGFTTKVEGAYREMWQRWCRNNVNKTA
jgi:protein O-GlcNAc transferase